MRRCVMNPGWLDCQRPPRITLRREAVLRGMKPSIGPATRDLAGQQGRVGIHRIVLQKCTNVDHMSFLNWPVEEVLPSRRVQHQRRRVVLDLLDKFSRAFPEVTYELRWESTTINAQAWRLGSGRYVRVYGGLVRHRAITKYGLALMLAHETGHHLGGLPRDPDMTWMTWQGQADYWAARTGMRLVFGPKADQMTLRAAREFFILHEDLSRLMDGDEPDLSASCRDRILRAGVSNREMPSCAR